MDGWAVLQIVLGASITIGFVIWMERIRKPKLVLRIEDPVNATYTNRPAQTARFLRLIIENKKLPRLLRWLSRNVAVRCHGVITFHHFDGQNIFGRSMQIKWSRSPEPVPIQAIASGSTGPLTIQIFDPVRLSPEMHRDIHTGELDILDVVARFDNDAECYGWCWDNYFSNPPWRNPDWKLNLGRYLVKVEVISAGEHCVDLFRLINDVPINAFRLENAQPSDYEAIFKKP